MTKHLQTAFAQTQVRVLGLLLSSIVLAVGCKQAKLAIDQTTLPLDRTITDIQGRSIKARIIGRSLDDIVIVKLPGNTRHVIPMSRLSAEDQRFARSLPIIEKTTAPAIPRQTESINRKSKLAELDEIHAKMRELNVTMQGLLSSTVKAKSLRKRLARLNEEETKVKKELNDLD